MSVTLSAANNARTNAGYATNLASDRFLNPENVVCPAWNGLDSAGRPATSNSFNTKCPGGNNALDRVVVENALRPPYSQRINTDASGYAATMYGNPSASLAKFDAANRSAAIHNSKNIAGNAGGSGVSSAVRATAPMNAYEVGQYSKQQQRANAGAKAEHYRTLASS